MIIRVATTSDLADLRQLAIDAFINAYAVFNKETDIQQYLAENFSEEVLRAELTNPDVVILLAEQENQILGYVKLVPGGSEDLKFIRPIEIARLYSAVHTIGNGIGKKLVAAVCDFARKNNYDGIWLGVWQKNFRAVNFYQREGFRITGVTVFKLGDDVQDDFIMAMQV
jgi:diamine N-acetyltransferase